MGVWTLNQWLTREDAALTPNNLPKEADQLPAWLERQAQDQDRQVYLCLVYDTPVGAAGLHLQEEAAELTLLLGE